MSLSPSPSAAGGPPGLVLAAPASGSGKTTVSLGLMRALSRSGIRVAPAKVGPDYIDPGFHTVAAGRESVNLDPWGMRSQTLGTLTTTLAQDSDLALVEGVMGLFDGAADGTGSTADLAAMLGWPVLLIIDARGQAASAAAVVWGFATHRPDVQIAGVLFNRVGSAAHAAMLKDGMDRAGLDIPILGYLPRDDALSVPSRHLGLVQAAEHADLESLLEKMADWVDSAVDLSALRALAMGRQDGPPSVSEASVPPLGQRIAVAQDTAFAFAYPHILLGWGAAGAEILPFSPLNDEGPDENCDAVFLPGGYPELYAGQLARSEGFKTALTRTATRGAVIYGECGGYMMLGETLIDAEGEAHEMAGLLPISTSFEDPKLHLGYRQISVIGDTPLGPSGTRYTGHEFHYASQIEAALCEPLFAPKDARGQEKSAAGARRANVVGSFLHLIDRQP